MRQYQAENLGTARALRVKALEILAGFDLANASLKDVAALLRLSSELTTTALDIRDLDRSIAACQRAGFEVILPQELTAKLKAVSAISGGQKDVNQRAA